MLERVGEDGGQVCGAGQAGDVHAHAQVGLRVALVKHAREDAVQVLLQVLSSRKAAVPVKHSCSRADRHGQVRRGISSRQGVGTMKASRRKHYTAKVSSGRGGARLGQQMPFLRLHNRAL